jgi:hypothetical protein
MRKLVLLVLLVAGLPPAAGEARVVRFVVEDRSLLADGVAWGSAGPYERLVGTAYLEVDPRDPLNAQIVDLDKAPKNARGAVEFRTAFFILKPVDMSQSNGKIYYTVNNRGNDALLNARTVSQVGLNDLPLRLGYTIVDAGWQGDLVPTPTRLAASLPIAVQPDGSPILGDVRVEFSDRNIPAEGTYTLGLKGSAAFSPYPAAVLEPASATFTVRDDVGAPRTRIAPDRWAFGRCPAGASSLTPSPTDICYFDGFRSDRLYELTYRAKDPIVMGLGYATTRDVASFLRFESSDAAGNANPLRAGGAKPVTRVYATGASQTGSYLRDFMYQGYNEDESNRKVFDGIIPTIAGSLRVFINVRFADPNVYTGQDDRHDYLQNSYPPFTYAVTADPVSGIKDGILKRPSTDPLVLHIDSSTEFWQLHAALNVVDGHGKAVAIPPNVRLYLNASTSHGFGAGGLLAPAPGRNPRCESPTPGGVGDTGRAMLVVMDQWADRGVLPPPSSYPSLTDGTLVTVDEARKTFPSLPGVHYPRAANGLEFLDFGPGFGPTGGVLTLNPPRASGKYPTLVPKPDVDGLDLAGFRGMQVAVPLGTTTGWNTRTRQNRPSNLCGLSGSYVPFARTRAERQASGDPRRSLEERYGNHAGFVEAVEKATRELVTARFLHPDDARRYVAAATESRIFR